MMTGSLILDYFLLIAGLYFTITGSSPLRRTRTSYDVRSRPRLTVVTTQVEPYVRLSWEPGLIGNDRYNGYFIDILRHVADDVGFDYQLKLVADGKCGSKTEEGGWNGMVGELMRGTAGLAVGPMIVTSEREDVIEFTSTITDAHITAVVRRSSPDVDDGLSITSLEDLLNQTQLTYGAIRGSDTEASLKSASGVKHRTLWNNIRHNYMTNTVENIYEGLERVRRERYALIMDALAAEYHIRQEPCDLITAGGFLGGRHYAFGIPKGSIIKDSINNALARLKSRYYDWAQIRQKWWSSNCEGINSYIDLGSTDTQAAVKGSETVELVSQPITASPQRHLTVTTLLKEPYVMRQSSSYYGYIVDLLDRISALVPFTYTLQEVKDGRKYGKKKKGQWNGMIGELLRDEADLAAAPFTKHRKQSRVLDYTKPFLYSTLSILNRVPKAEEENIIFFMEELLNHTDIQFGVVRGSLTERQIKSSKEPLYRQIWAKLQQWKNTNIFRSLSKAIKRVRNGKFVLLLESTDGAHVSSKPPCDLMPQDQWMSITDYMFALKKGSPLVESINAALLQLQEDGVLQMLFHKWWSNSQCLGGSLEEDGVLVFNDTDQESLEHPSETQFGGASYAPPVGDIYHYDTFTPDISAFINNDNHRIIDDSGGHDSHRIVDDGGGLPSTTARTSTSTLKTNLLNTPVSRPTPFNLPIENNQTVPNITLSSHFTPGQGDSLDAPEDNHTQSITTPEHLVVDNASSPTNTPSTIGNVTVAIKTTQTTKQTWLLQKIDFDLLFSSSKPNNKNDDVEETFEYHEGTTWDPLVDMWTKPKTGVTPLSTIRVPGTSITPGPTGKTTKSDSDKDTGQNEVKQNTSSGGGGSKPKPSLYAKVVVFIALSFQVIGGG